MHPAPDFLRRRDVLGLGSVVLAACFAPEAAAAQEPGRAAVDDGIGTVWWVELVSSDGGRPFDYYKSTLAWSSRVTAPSAEETSEGASGYTLFEAAGSEVAGATVAKSSDPVKNRPMWIVYFRVENVEKSIARALESGGKLLQVPYDVPGSARMAVLSDLDGLIFGIAAPLQT